MSNVSALMNKKNQYISCYNREKIIQSALVKSLEQLNIVLQNQSKAYQLDEVIASGNYIEDLMELEKEIHATLSNTVMPTTVNLINRTTTRIKEAIIEESIDMEIV